VRRGYFTLGVGATQFAQPAALELLRSLRNAPAGSGAEPGREERDEVVQVAATDPANPYGSILRWPPADTPLAGAIRGPTRSVGASVVLVNGQLGAFVARGGRAVITCLPENEPERSKAGRAIAGRLADTAAADEGSGGLLISEINGAAATTHPLGRWLVEAGFLATALGYLRPRARRAVVAEERVTKLAGGGGHDTGDGHQPQARDAGLVHEEVPEDGPARPAARRRRSLVSSPFAALRRR
jgi:ATP-dependent Lhr-like helicase